MNKILILFLSLLPCAAVFCQDSLPVIPDEEYRLACGPIAGLIALESLGVATDLPEIASRCHSLSLRRRAMNSKNFLFAAVFVILSFFAICFVWEMRSALPVDTQRDISVGACVGGQARSIRINACVSKPQQICESLVLHDVVVPFPCGHDVTVETLTGECKHETAYDQPCLPSNGYYLMVSEGGDYVQGDPESCGTREAVKCQDRVVRTYPLIHICPDNNNNGNNNEPVILQAELHECTEKPNSTTNEPCGEKATVTGC